MNGGKVKKQLFLLLFIVSFNSLLVSTIWEIKQNGTGNFTTIQEGIDASANADTVLVYPETYLENINYNGKSITVGSLYLTTGDEQYIHQTVINGDQSGSCVRIKSGEDNTTLLCGFTLTNGNGSTTYAGGFKLGGGILIRDSQPNIEHCFILNNTAFSGGGISIGNSAIVLKAVTIKNNHAYFGGGGICFGSNGAINFDENELCNIYLNYAALGCEIAKGQNSPFLDVVVDTFTVSEPDSYFIWNNDGSGYPLNDVTLSCQNAMLTPVNADLYVSTEGDNNNCGLTPNEPLATINYALSLIKSDSLQQNTIYIADGLYSKNENNNCFPLAMRSFVSLYGQSMENTIFNSELNSGLIFDDSYGYLDYSISNIKLINGFDDPGIVSGIKIRTNKHNRHIQLNNLEIYNCRTTNYHFDIQKVNLDMNNIKVYSNYGGFLSVVDYINDENNVNISNVTCRDNHQYNPASISSDARPQFLFNSLGTSPMNLTLINLEITDNIQSQSDWPITSAGIILGDSVSANIVNCTIGNNSSPGSGGVFLLGLSSQGTTANIYNSILYGNSPDEIYVGNDFSANPTTVNIQNSLVAGGEAGIQNPYSWNQVYWLENNLEEDPFWLGIGDYPYYLQSISPCIDAGTLDLPPGIELPQYDLVGNPRIYGNTVDMGAYEWQGVGVEEPEIPQLLPTITHISNYPNPFNPSTTIKLELAEAGEIELAIYNIKGQKVKTLLKCTTTPGIYECNWNGKDEAGKCVSSGQYVLKLRQNSKETATKIMLLK